MPRTHLSLRRLGVEHSRLRSFGGVVVGVLLVVSTGFSLSQGVRGPVASTNELSLAIHHSRHTAIWE